MLKFHWKNELVGNTIWFSKICIHLEPSVMKKVHNVELQKIYRLGNSGWSSGQRAQLLLWRSEFESCLSLQFSLRKICLKGTKINEKEAENGPFKNIDSVKTIKSITCPYSKRFNTPWLVKKLAANKSALPRVPKFIVQFLFIGCTVRWM